MNMIINGKQTIYSGGSISVIDGQVIIDGREVMVEDSKAPISIVIEGNAGDISGDFTDVTVKGSAEAIKTTNGNVKVGRDVTNGGVETKYGDVKVAGSILTDNVSTKYGNVKAGGTITGKIK